MSRQKYPVKMQELPDEEMNFQTMQQNNTSTQSDPDSWRQVENMENQARQEKMKDAFEQMKTAHKVAHIFEKDTHQKSQ